MSPERVPGRVRSKGSLKEALADTAGLDNLKLVSTAL